ncbi:hypothetical protein A2U01_0097203 [Trifolium medium]|uniref:Uncharacterized protein n=1 Tax=Trifolium medium TaxID=97028 RepID=A0A392UTJ4_9FABA|nr:hypothetical protein [Trifolium medium]
MMELMKIGGNFSGLTNLMSPPSDASSPDEDDGTVSVRSKGRVFKPSPEVGPKPKSPR